MPRCSPNRQIFVLPPALFVAGEAAFSGAEGQKAAICPYRLTSVYRPQVALNLPSEGREDAQEVYRRKMGFRDTRGTGSINAVFHTASGSVRVGQSKGNIK